MRRRVLESSIVKGPTDWSNYNYNITPERPDILNLRTKIGDTTYYSRIIPGAYPSNDIDLGVGVVDISPEGEISNFQLSKNYVLEAYVGISLYYIGDSNTIINSDLIPTTFNPSHQLLAFMYAGVAGNPSDGLPYGDKPEIPSNFVDRAFDYLLFGIRTGGDGNNSGSYFNTTIDGSYPIEAYDINPLDMDMLVVGQDANGNINYDIVLFRLETWVLHIISVQNRGRQMTIAADLTGVDINT